jgi:hypothetical protein
VVVSVKDFVIGVAMRELMSQTGIAAVAAGTGSQPRFEEQDRASQITAHLIRNGQAHHAMRVEFPAHLFNRLARTTAGRRESHDLDDAHIRSAPVISRHAAPYVALGDDSDQLEIFYILNHRPRSRSLNPASLARHMPPNLAAYSTKTLRLVSSHRYNSSFSFLPSCSAQRFI